MMCECGGSMVRVIYHVGFIGGLKYALWCVRYKYEEREGLLAQGVSANQEMPKGMGAASDEKVCGLSNVSHSKFPTTLLTTIQPLQI